MYSTYNEGKSVVAERFIRMLKNKIFKHMTAVSKNVEFDVLDGIVNKFNNIVHRSIKMKPIDVTTDSYAEYNEDSNEKDPKSKVGDHVRISKYKIIFAKGYNPNWSEVFVVSKIKNTVPWTYVINDLNGDSITGSFYEKDLQKTSAKKCLKEKGIKCMWNGKSMIIHLIVGLIKNIFNEILSLQMSQYFPKLFRSFGGNINVKVDLSNYATKSDLKNVTHVDVSSFVLKTNLASLKTEIDKLDIAKLAPVPVDLSKLSNVVKNDFVKKVVMINWLQK